MNINNISSNSGTFSKASSLNTNLVGSGNSLDSSGGLGLEFASLLNSSTSETSALNSSLVGNDSKPFGEGAAPDEKLRETFNDFVGQTFFGQLLSSMRSTQQEAAYFNGGRAEKIFQGQLDQVLSEELSKSSASQIADPMFKLFQANRL